MKINEINRLELKNATLEDLISLVASAKNIIATCAELKLEVPKGLENKQREAVREINERARVERQAALQKLEARRAALSTAEEKRANLDKEIAELKASLA